MSSISEHFVDIQETLDIMNREGHVTETDEFVAITDIEIALKRARKVFERTKQIEKEKQK